MRTAAVAFVTSALAAAVATPIVRSVALRHGALDHALTSRKIHGRPIPRVGGIAIFVAFLAPLLALLFVSSDVGRQFYSSPEKAFGLFAGCSIIAAIGIWDDLKGANARTKFIVQFGAATLMYALGFRIDHIANPFGASIHLGWLGLPFTVLWITGITNALNLVDGLDGLAGGVALIAIATTFVIAFIQKQPLMVLFASALAGAVLGFLFYNFNPATVFMGDTGSMFLGFTLATTAIQTNQKSSTSVAIIVPIIALGLPIADTLLAMARRAARGLPMFAGDRGHIHHRLVANGYSHRNAVLVLYAVSAVLGGVALVLAFASPRHASIVLLAAALLAFVALRWLGFLRFSSVPRLFEDRRRNVAIRKGMRQVAGQLKIAVDTTDVWSAVRVAAGVLEACAVAIQPTGGAGPTLTDGFDICCDSVFRARYGLVPERPGDAFIEFGWTDGRNSIDRDTEIAIELLCDHLASTIDRLTREVANEAASVKQAG